MCFANIKIECVNTVAETKELQQGWRHIGKLVANSAIHGQARLLPAKWSRPFALLPN
jgi:hypothetical protein